MHSILIVLLFQVAALPAVLEIVVPASAVKSTSETIKSLAEPRRKAGPINRTFPAPGFREYPQPEVPVRIVVDEYDPQRGPWGARKSWTAASLKAELQSMMAAPAEGYFYEPIWSEISGWSAAATVTFKDGKQAKIVFDGLHGCYEDPDGYRWFFRYHIDRKADA